MDYLNDYPDSAPENEMNPPLMQENNIPPAEILIGDRAAQIEQDLNWDDFILVINSIKSKAF